MGIFLILLPSDIDKLDVMKDASSACRLRGLGASGLFWLLPKRGTSDKPTINNNYGLVWVWHLMRMRKRPIRRTRLCNGD